MKKIKNAEANGAYDTDECENIDAINRADRLICQTEKTLVKTSDNIPECEKGEIQAAILTLREKAIVDDPEGIITATAALVKASIKMTGVI
jgi:molecular chaperone DnaK (HSP70)